jgi:hypothetical protein
MWVCPECGEKLGNVFKKCNRCGAWRPRETMPPVAQQPEAEYIKPILGAVRVLFVGIFLLAIPFCLVFAWKGEWFTAVQIASSGIVSAVALAILEIERHLRK